MITKMMAVCLENAWKTLSESEKSEDSRGKMTATTIDGMMISDSRTLKPIAYWPATTDPVIASIMMESVRK